MKPTQPLAILRQLSTAALLVFSLLPFASASAQPAGRPGPTSPSAAQPLSPGASACQWTYYPIKNGKLQPELPLLNDPDNTPIANLNLGSMFLGKSAKLAATGSADFNGDNKTDVFRAIPRTDGNLQWQYSSGGAAPWQNLAYADPSLLASQLQFGEFDGDAKSDVFANLYTFPTYYWDYSSGGTGSFVNLQSTGFFSVRLTLGDFNGDGVTDIFEANQNNNTEQWYYYPSGTGSQTKLAYAGTDPALLRFGDFNGDKKTDVFAGVQQPNGSTQWVYSSGGAASYVNLALTNVPYADLLFGDFNGDGKTDVIAPVHQADGSLDIQFWSGGTGAPVSLGRIPAPAPALRVGDFNGDGISDLFAYRCGMKAPLSFTGRQTLAAASFNTFQRSIYGDVNGDGYNDVILVSTCQNPTSGVCATHHLQVGVTLGSPNHTYSLVPPEQLGADALDFEYYRAEAGDFNGDGKTDLALIDTYANSGTDLILYVALSNGDGTFTLGAPQTFAGDWGDYNPLVGDFNGDGKADLAFTSVCNRQALYAGSCSSGDNNTVVLATSNGAGVFSLGAGQNLGTATGWADYYAFTGDFNGDGKTDLVFNSTCQNKPGDLTCMVGNANLVYTALSNGSGGFTLSALQNFGSSGWGDYPVSVDLTADVNGDGRTDLVWSSIHQKSSETYRNLIVLGTANSDGTFQMGPVQDLGSAVGGWPTLANLNHDGRADLLWNGPQNGDSDVDIYTAALSNGNGSFESLGPGSVDTGFGYFSVPDNDSYSKLPTGLTLLSTQQDSISSALMAINGSWQSGMAYLPFMQK